MTPEFKKLFKVFGNFTFRKNAAYYEAERLICIPDAELGQDGDDRCYQLMIRLDTKSEKQAARRAQAILRLMANHPRITAWKKKPTWQQVDG